ncbi:MULTISPECIES: 8-amino-7-oxononanoate synthase [unclassified Hyphomicrobium]|uniref:8-amino-7-oxononanoate synthase n=1 Tax=unclassified Hyphomicrobium TaxID=2619925 RepID=UPI000213E005|nr:MULTISPECIES: 8-amino-7-oxononanoate synthase [unclassified Hyphomicrobium]CCB67646.1 8-amino-7-oxononanoate synthase [Hyphomicrobium sp. MC1]
MPGNHERALDALSRRGRLRTLEPAHGLDFTSNDYLGLAQSRALADAIEGAIARGVPVGSGGSRLLRGNHAEHELLEQEAAHFFGGETALYFGGGFIANTALFSTLPARGDLIVYDELIHASAHEGMRLSKAEAKAVRHNDAQGVDDAITAWRATGGTGQPWIAIESLYSMDGDRAPIAELATIADRHEAMLIVDEAHATGVLGPDGRGLAADLEGRENVVTVHTCGKALGAMGALVIAPRTIRDFLVNRGRAFVYATAPSPLMAAAVRAALNICRNDPLRRQRLHDLVAFAARELTTKTRFAASGSQIQPLIIGSDGTAMALATAMKTRGYDIRAIRPPTVPEGTSRLRLTITLNVSELEITRLIDDLAAAEAENAA